MAEWAKQRDGDHVPKAGAADSAWDDDEDDVPPPPPPKSTKGVAPPKKKDADGNDIDEVCNEAVLIFLPGMKEITTLQEAIFSTRGFQSEEARRWVLPLHSTVPPEDQRLVFVRPPPGMKKIVLATNIAETAITIDDIGFVIDTGRMKELRYDPQRRMSSLEDVVVTRANAKQRRGRAGRVKEGGLMNPEPLPAIACVYHLYHLCASGPPRHHQPIIMTPVVGGSQPARLTAAASTQLRPHPPPERLLAWLTRAH